MKTRATLVAGLLAISLASGCAAALVGAGVAGGYAISKDSVRNTFDLPKDQVFQESLAVANDMGFVKLEDPAHGEIKLKIDDTTVTINVKRLSKKTVELKVSARNQFLMPEVDVAQDVYNRIIDRLP